jgi:adenylate cyclase class IV
MKFRVATLASARDAVLRAGGEFLHEALQTDCYFDTPDAKLMAGDRGLRLRETGDCPATKGTVPFLPKKGTVPFVAAATQGKGYSPRQTAAGTVPFSPLLTYKGPRLARGRAKSRVEIQTTVEDPKAIEDILRALGLVRRLVIQKRRASYRLGRCLVELDELPILGCFVEIEGASARAIDAAARHIGLTGEPLKAGYIHLAEEACPRAGRQCLEITFARCRGCKR